MLLKAYINLIESTPLFHAVAREDLERLLGCVGAYAEFYERGEIILHESEPIDKLLIVVAGTIEERTKDISGIYHSVRRYNAGELFGDSAVSVGVIGSLQSVVAAENSAVAMIDYEKFMTVCQNACPAHTAAIKNLFNMIVRKNLLDERRVTILSKPNIRERLLCFLEIQREMASADEFVIPYSRESLSEYLCVDRSALSREIGKMKADHLIEYRKNLFKLIPKNIDVH